ncbi:MAG: hypothetical protein QOE27_1989, partial [Solirubrobacteraceae bacterium]|nr:hypothetical protein [Solirubrobacteraceae bacterium]
MASVHTAVDLDALDAITEAVES